MPTTPNVQPGDTSSAWAVAFAQLGCAVACIAGFCFCAWLCAGAPGVSP